MSRADRGWFGRALFFSLAPESAHRLALTGLRVLGATGLGRAGLRRAFGAPEAGAVTLWRLRFRNPVGLAAGWDKDGLGLHGLSALGFGHVEIGTVTPRPQAGNPRPRIFRLTGERALINRMGFPGQGAEVVARRLEAFRRRAPRYTPGGPALSHPVIGVNIGKNKDTDNARAADDYAALIRRFAGLADYLVINVSSPNTAGLRDLQAEASLQALLAAALKARGESDAPQTPIVLKISPDLEVEDLDALVAAALEGGVDGLIVSNTTLSREGVRDPQREEAGGLSGAPLTARADRLLGEVVARVRGRVPVIASGGVMDAADAARRLALGASLVQVYTGLIFGGPGWLRRTVMALDAARRGGQ